MGRLSTTECTYLPSSVSVARVLWPCWSLLPYCPDGSTLVFKYAYIPDGRVEGTQVSQCACDPRWLDIRYPNSGLLAVVSDPESFDILQFFNGVEC